jgi:hypothetical protein
MRLLVNLARIQGIYFFIMGLWPVLDLDSFMDVTGPKTDTWLVRTAGVLIAAIGLALLVEQRKQRVDPSIIVLSIVSSLGLGLIDVLNSITMRIPVIYLADAFIEAIFCTAWTVGSLRVRRAHRTADHSQQSPTRHRHG